jgi:hypothetical protein
VQIVIRLQSWCSQAEGGASIGSSAWVGVWANRQPLAQASRRTKRTAAIAITNTV